MSDDAPGVERFKVMERKLYYGIMTPGAVLTIFFGLWLWLGYGISGGWLHAKLALVSSSHTTSIAANCLPISSMIVTAMVTSITAGSMKFQW